MVLFKRLGPFHATEWQFFDVPVLTWFYNTLPMTSMDSWLQNKLLSGKHGESTIFAMRCSPRPLRSITRVVEKCAKMLPEAWARPQDTKLSCDWHGWSTSRIWNPLNTFSFPFDTSWGWRSSRPPTGLG